MNRRQFLVSLGIGAPAAVLAAKMPMLEAKPHAFDNHGASSGICQACGGIAPDHAELIDQSGVIAKLVPMRVRQITFIKGWTPWDVAADGLLSHNGVSEFQTYAEDGGLDWKIARYYWRSGQLFQRIESTEEELIRPIYSYLYA